MDFHSIDFSVKGFRAEDVLGDIYKTIIFGTQPMSLWGAKSLISCGPAVSFQQEKPRSSRPGTREAGDSSN